MNKTELRQWAEETVAIDYLNTTGKAVKTPERIAQGIGWSYRKTLRVLHRLEERGQVYSVGNQYQTWYYSSERCLPIDTGIPF